MGTGTSGRWRVALISLCLALVMSAGHLAVVIAQEAPSRFPAPSVPRIPPLPPLPVDSVSPPAPPAVDQSESAASLKRLLESLAKGDEPEIREQYAAAVLTPADREDFLKRAMTHRLRAVRKLAFDELVRRDLLNRVVVDSLLELAREPQAADVEAAVVGLERLDIAAAPEEYIVTLLQQLSPNSQNEQARAAAETQLVRLRTTALPVLVGIVLDRSADPTLRQTAASRLSILMGRAPALPNFLPRIPGSFPYSSGEPGPGDILPSYGPSGGAAPPDSGPAGSGFPASPSSEFPNIAPSPLPPESSPGAPAPSGVPPLPTTPASRVSLQDTTARPQQVRVYYGTNREALVPATSPKWLPLANLSGGALLALIVILVVGALRKWSYRMLTATGVVTLLLACVVGWIWNPFEPYSRAVEQSRGVVFGPRADAEGLVHFGHCDVTLPPVGKREVGDLPMTTPGKENPEEHVILKRTELLEEEAFYSEVRARVAGLSAGERDVFVFVHGYNVDFRSAACRTAQLSLDLEFKGVPMFFSWPSQAEFLGYAADVDEVQDSVGPIKKFLLRVAQDLNAEKVHVLAHSRGGAAVSFALREIDPHKRLFNQVILAAPDINANTFRRDIAPQLGKLALRSTLYCSQTDRALWGSKLFNGYKRAGDASDPIVIEPFLDTVDATGLDPSILGHSYYGECEQLIKDVRQLFRQNSHPAERGLLERKGQVGDQVYWMFKVSG